MPFAFGVVVISAVAAPTGSAASASTTAAVVVVGGGVDDIVRVLTSFTLQLFYFLYDICMSVCV